MLTRLLNLWPHALALLVVYLVIPAALTAVANAAPDPGAWKAAVFFSLLGLNPAASFVVAGLAGYRHGFAWPLLLAVPVLFVPAAYLVYNDSALVYGLLYAVFAALGLAVGWGVRRVQRRRPAAGR